jgi:hypothetical protein
MIIIAHLNPARLPAMVRDTRFGPQREWGIIGVDIVVILEVYLPSGETRWPGE